MDIEQDITEILAKHDLQGLIKMGAPKDEYHPETVYIMYFLLEQKHEKEITVENIAEELYNIFSYQFSPIDAGEVKYYIRAAEDIFSLFSRKL